MKLRLPFDSPLPERLLPRIAVLLMLAVGALVALLVFVVFLVTLIEMMRG